MHEKPSYSELEQRVEKLEATVKNLKIAENTGSPVGTQETHLKIDRALREIEDRFSSMFEHMGSGVAVYEAVDGGDDFVFKAFNSAAEKITHISREQALGHRLLELFPGMVKSDFIQTLYRVWKTGNAEHIPPFYYKDKTRKGWRENRIYKLPSNEIVALFDDVTERKDFEEKLIESEERMRIILDSIPDMVLQVDREMRILWANKTALTLNHNALGQTYFNAFPGKKIVGESCPCEKSLKNGKVESEIRYQPDSKTAGESYWESICVPLKNRKNEVTSVIEISRNITERMQAEKKERQIHKAESLNPDLWNHNAEKRV